MAPKASFPSSDYVGTMTDDSTTDWEFEAEFADVLAAVPDEHFDHDRFVPGVGPLAARVLVVGESPGGREVEQGEPFVGQAGSQLDRALESIGRDRRDLYLTNLVKVRPPENRDPHVAEIEAWWPVLAAEMDRVDPDVLVPLGSFATDRLLDADAAISDVHGEAFDVDGRTAVPAYHPAAALYDRSKVGELEADLAAAFEHA